MDGGSSETEQQAIVVETTKVDGSSPNIVIMIGLVGLGITAGLDNAQRVCLGIPKCSGRGAVACIDRYDQLQGTSPDVN